MELNLLRAFTVVISNLRGPDDWKFKTDLKSRSFVIRLQMSTFPLRGPSLHQIHLETLTLQPLEALSRLAVAPSAPMVTLSNCAFQPTPGSHATLDPALSFGELLHQCGPYSQRLPTPGPTNLIATYRFGGLQFRLRGCWEPAALTPEGLRFEPLNPDPVDLGAVLVELKFLGPTVLLPEPRPLDPPGLFWVNRQGTLISGRSHLIWQPRDLRLELLLVYASEAWELIEGVVIQSPETRITQISDSWGPKHRESRVGCEIQSPVIFHTAVGPIDTAGRIQIWEHIAELKLQVSEPRQIEAVVSSLVQRPITFLELGRQFQPGLTLEATGEVSLSYDLDRKLQTGGSIAVETYFEIYPGRSLQLKGGVWPSEKLVVFYGHIKKCMRLGELLPPEQAMRGSLAEINLKMLQIKIGPLEDSSKSYVLWGHIYEPKVQGEIRYTLIQLKMYREAPSQELRITIDGSLGVRCRRQVSVGYEFKSSFERNTWLGKFSLEPTTFRTIGRLLPREISAPLQNLFCKTRFVSTKIVFELGEGQVKELQAQNQIKGVNLGVKYDGWQSRNQELKIKILETERGMDQVAQFWEHFRVSQREPNREITPELRLSVEWSPN